MCVFKCSVSEHIATPSSSDVVVIVGGVPISNTILTIRSRDLYREISAG